MPRAQAGSSWARPRGDGLGQRLGGLLGQGLGAELGLGLELDAAIGGVISSRVRWSARRIRARRTFSDRLQSRSM